MERPLQLSSAAHTRRRALASAAGISAAAALSGCHAYGTDASSSPSATLDVDFGRTAFSPLTKSKIGVGRALNSNDVLDGLHFLDDIRPALYDAEVRFPNTDWPSLTPYPFEVRDGSVEVRSNRYFDTLYTELRRRNIEIMDQLEGAPIQWWDREKAKRPHLFPLPTDLKAAADAVAKWTGLYSDYPISYCMWNEPNHNLTGSPDLASIHQIVDIYDAYTSAIASRVRGLFGMASFIISSSTTHPGLGGRTYFEAVIDELRQRRKAKPDLPFDYLTMNNYGEPVDELLNGARNALGGDFNTVPLIQAQFGVFKPHDWEKKAGTSLEAARSMAALHEMLRISDLQVVTFSGWLPHMINYRRGKTLQLPLFNALKLYARMPDRQATVNGRLPSGLGAMASGDEYRGAVMVWNESSQPHRVRIDLSHLGAASRSGAELHVYHIDSQHGSPLEHGDKEFGPDEVTRLDQHSGTLSKTVTVAGPGVAYVEVGTASSHPVLDRDGLTAKLVRKHSYADRVTGARGKTVVRGDAYGYYDAVRAVAYLGVRGEAGTALCGAEYSDLPSTLQVDIWTDSLAARPGSPEALFGIRVDYLVAGSAARSVLWHGDLFTSRRTQHLPWGRGGATADLVLRAPELDGARVNGSRLTLPLAAHAPSGWAEAGQQAIISFWMDSTGPGSQARFLLDSP